MVLTRSRAHQTPLENNAENNNKPSGDAKSKDESKRANKVLGVLFISLVVDLLAFTMILPLLPALLDHYGKQEKDNLYSTLKNSVHGFRELVGAPDTPRWNSVLFGGLIGSVFSLLQFLASPLMGAASDVYGRRALLLISMTGVSLSYVLWALSHSFTVFVIARIVGGLSKGNVSISTAVVADVLPQEKRGKGMAMIGIAFSIGFLLGPSIGAGFSSYMRQHEGEGGNLYIYPALFALTLALFDLIFLYTCFTETLPSNKRASSLGEGLSQALTLINPVSLFKFSAVTRTSRAELQQMRHIGLVYFLYMFFYSGLEFTLTFLTHNRFEYDSMKQGRMFLFIGIIMIAVQGGYVRRLKTGSEQKIAIRGMQILIPSFIIVAFAYNQTLFYVGLLLFSFASATVVPCLTTMISSYGTVEQKGTVMGIFRSLGALARAVGPMLASTVYWTSGDQICYITGAVALILPLCLLSFTKIGQHAKTH